MGGENFSPIYGVVSGTDVVTSMIEEVKHESLQQLSTVSESGVNIPSVSSDLFSTLVFFLTFFPNCTHFALEIGADVWFHK